MAERKGIGGISLGGILVIIGKESVPELVHPGEEPEVAAK
jgi:hypothetical protein